MATSCPTIETDDLLEFCLRPWMAVENEDITAKELATAAKVVHLLVSAKRFEVLENFVSSLPEGVLNVFLKNERFRRALITWRCLQEHYEEVCELIRSGSFVDGTDLLEVWDHAHYAIWERKHGKSLTALSRFRIRKKNPPPPSICQEGRPTRNLDEAARATLTLWLHEHADQPYPTYAERQQMVQKTGLTHIQIRTWFANARRRTHRRNKQGKRVVVMPMRRKLRGMNTGEEKCAVRSQAVAAHQSVGGPVYLQPLPILQGTPESSGLQGLMHMYSRLTTQGSYVGNPNSPGHAVDLVHPSPQHQRHQSCFQTNPYSPVNSSHVIGTPALSVRQLQARSSSRPSTVQSTSAPMPHLPETAALQTVPSAFQSPLALTTIDAQAKEKSAVSLMPQSAMPVLGMEMLDDNNAYAASRDQCLAMWNPSSWFSAQNILVSPTNLAELAKGEDQTTLNQDSKEYQAEAFSLSATPGLFYGETAPLPQAPDAFFVLQATASVSSPVGMELITANNLQTGCLTRDFWTQSSDFLEGTGADIDEEAAHILLNLATTKPSS